MILTLAGLQVGSSSEIYPAASYGPILAARGIPVAEFNLDTTPVTHQLKYVTFTPSHMHTAVHCTHTHAPTHTNNRFHFQGKCGATVPEALLTNA